MNSSVYAECRIVPPPRISRMRISDADSSGFSSSTFLGWPDERYLTLRVESKHNRWNETSRVYPYVNYRSKQSQLDSRMRFAIQSLTSHAHATINANTPDRDDVTILFKAPTRQLYDVYIIRVAD